MKRLQIIHGDTLLELDPHAGGSVSALRHGDLDILRPAPVRTGNTFDAIDYAAFPMIPFVGRIYEGRFQQDNTEIQLLANMPPEPHAIHGHGWRSTWQVASTCDSAAKLVYEHPADTWPWSYQATQSFRVLPDGLEIALQVTNQSASAMPAGIGWHPYFPRSNAYLSVNTTHVWSLDEATGDTRQQQILPKDDLSNGRPVETLDLDTSFSLGSREVHITWPTHKVHITSDPVFLGSTVFVPPGHDFFCVEPISHVPNAVNCELPQSSTGLRWLAPGETLAGTITLKIIC